eukprot:XP_011666118.1 PREDICTED: sialin [Strongylocentrotus purpuratus]
MGSPDPIEEDCNHRPDHGPNNETISARNAHDNGYDDDWHSIELGEKKPLLGDKEGQGRKEGGCYVPKRYELLFLAWLGTAMMFVMRINVSVTMAVMTNATFTTQAEDPNRTAKTCRSPNSTSEDENGQDGGEFLWSSHEQELILAGFFYGYAAAQIPGGWLTDKIGGTRVFGISMFLSAAVSLLSPIAAKLGYSYFFAVRILCGIGEAGTFPALGSMVARWFPPQDFSAAFSIALSSAKFGTFIGTVLSGLISGSDLLGGWPMTYYAFGGFSLVLVVVWMARIYETPGRHPRISSKEKQYLSTTVITEKTEKISIPVVDMLTSIPVWTIIVTSFCGSWTNQAMFTNLPIYLKHVQGMDIELIGIAAAIPFAVESFFLVVGGMISNKLIKRQVLGVITTRKLVTFIGFALSALCFLLLAYVGCDTVLAVVFMIGAVGFNGICTCGYYVNLMDIAPRLAGSLIGLVNSSSAFSGAISPYVVGVLTPNQSDITGWQTVFIICCGINSFACLVFLVFGSGKEQKWAKQPGKDDS